jgi:hypothetical protein
MENLEYVAQILFHKLVIAPESFKWPTAEKVQLLFADDAWIAQAICHEISYGNKYKNIHAQHIEKIQSIIKNFKIDQTDYRYLLKEKITQYCLQVNENFFRIGNACLI